MKKVIHINQHNIKHNRKSEDKKPVITCKTYLENIKCNGLEIDGPCKIVYSPNKPLPCGATVWIETKSEIRILEDL